MLPSGTRLGPYEIQAAIGAGGMGEVYQATDTNLKRQVAIKVLPESVAADPERLARFQREAEVLAALNHPHIAGIYGLEKSSGTTALVMELVEGPSLADRLAQGPIPADEALRIAKQIAEALEAAHEHGIVHRDLKPANVKVRDDGMVKVLDFGLAKALLPVGTPPGMSQSPTLTSPAMMTGMGVILGTVAYMAPEQAKGKPVDKRADIWAFGCVLYEMLTGRRAFPGDEIAGTLAKVLEAQPDWPTSGAVISPRVQELVRRCLEKDPRRRLRDIGDALVDLQDTAASGGIVGRTTTSGPTRPTSAWRSLAGLAILAFGVAAGGIGVWRFTKPRDVDVLRFDIAQATRFETAVGTDITRIGGNLAISPTGREIVFGGVGVYMRSLDQLEVRTLAGPGSQQPFMSPNGDWVGFLNGTTLKKVSVNGGPALTIGPVGGTALEGASWGTDDTIVFTTNNASGLFRISAQGGQPAPLTSVNSQEGEVEHRWPEVLPGGRAILFTIFWGDSTAKGTQIAALDLATGERRIVVPRGGQARYVPTGHLVYGIDGALWAVPFDAGELVARGDPVRVLPDVLTTPVGGADFAVARDGSLVYVSGGALVERRRLVWVDRQGREEPIDAPVRAYAHARVSPDGRSLALDVRDQGEDIWVWGVVTKTLTRVTLDPGFDRQPIWAPDSRQIAFYSSRGGTNSLLMVSADGAGPVRRLLERPSSAMYATSFSPNGKQLVLWESTADRGLDVEVLDLDDVQRGATALLDTAGDERNAEISPDGRWIAYQANDSGQNEVYVRPYQMPQNERWQVSNGGGTRPMWAPDGRELFYYADAARRIMVVSVTSDTTFTRGTPHVLFGEAPLMTLSSRTYDISPDGRRFLFIKEAEAADAAATSRRITFVLNWTEELKRLVPVN